MTTKKTNQTTVQTRDAQIIVGIGKHMQNVPSIVLLGTSYTPSTLTQPTRPRSARWRASPPSELN